MVEELRKIILTKEEIFDAIDAYRRTVPDFLPHGDIIRCQPGADSTFVIIIKLAYGKNNKEMEFNYKLTDLLGPIIQFCIENNIILPRNSRKCVKMEGDRVCLYIAMESPMTINPASQQKLPVKK